MLEIKPVCENCGKKLPPNSEEARICSFECTFCANCVDDILHNVCPNCGGGFEKRPVRPVHELVTDPASTKEFISPINMQKLEAFQVRFKDVKPSER